MAQLGGCKNFIAHSLIQKILTNIWNGHNSVQSGTIQYLKVKIKKQNFHKFKKFLFQNFKFLISCLSFGILAPFIMENEDNWIRVNVNQ